MFKNVIWDFDGTLFDTYPNMVNAFKKAMADDGIEEDAVEILFQMKKSVSHEIDFYKQKHDITDEMIQRYVDYEAETNIELIRPFENALELCQEIHLSKGKNFLFTHRDGAALDYLKHYGFYGYLDDFVTSGDGFKKKPDPSAILHLIRKYNLDKKETIMIGDRDMDLIAGKNAGIKSCFFRTGPNEVSCNADYTVGSMKELYRIIGL